jgi:uncharacterized protein (TIGR03437 family)
MRKLSLIVFGFVLASAAEAQSLRIVNAASLSPVNIAPGSIFTIFGNRLATGVTFATNVVTPPTSLSGATVTIGGSAAALFYVSPTQINGVVDPATHTGVQTVTVASSAGTQTAAVTIAANAPPGLFSLFGTGTRDGAILNAITFLLGDFSTRTANSPTFLALFATGLNLASAPVVTIGGVPVPVVFFGAAPCCDGLQQINIMLPDSLAGAGRVPVVVTSNGVASNTVQVVLLPPTGQGAFSDDPENTTRSRELASLAYVPGTSLVLSADENDDVVRVVDVSLRKVSQVIALPTGSKPEGIAVNAAGTIAAVAQAGSGKVAILDLTKFLVTAQLATGPGALRVAIGGSQAVVVNQDNDTVSIVDLSSQTVQKTLIVGRGPEGVAVDSSTGRAYVTNEDDGTVSVIDLTALAVINTFTLGASVRPEAIAVAPGTSTAFITVPAAGPDGQVIMLNLTTGAQTSFNANPDHNGGSSDVVVFNSKVYVANQAGGSVSVLPVTASPTIPIATIKVDLGVRALAVDVKDNLLVVSNEGSGTLVLVDLGSNKVVARINAVQTNMQGDDGHDNHSDRGGASNAPTIQTLSPSSAKAGATVTLTITGTNLTGSGKLIFIDQRQHGKVSHDEGGGGDNGGGGADPAFTVSSLQVAAGGNQLTALVAIAASASSGPRLVLVSAANGESSDKTSVANTFTVQ